MDSGTSFRIELSSNGLPEPKQPKNTFPRRSFRRPLLPPAASSAVGAAAEPDRKQKKGGGFLSAHIESPISETVTVG
ncbi:hypothetical protein HPP92_020388 [Vanilla planifolia]|uniref:Uncharacterized protein n=1 Tax=Vanilla planifolia TaxID=51239 RepID=A0A835UIF6_VANPL|nr:hypothetical protein HPP92_020388 [Vanilla planifolia]